MPTQTRTQAAQVHATTNPESTSTVNLHCDTALVSLGTARRLPNDELDSDEPDDLNPGGDDPSDDGPGDDRLGDDPDNDAEDPLPEDDVKPGVTVLDNLAKAIKLLACNTHTGSESSSRTKLHELDTFDRTDPKKLCTFIPHSVTFAQSFLKGMALEWIKPDLLGTEDPEDWPYWMDLWKEFIIGLQTTFGPHNPVADAESQLEHLQMKEIHQVNKYMVELNWLASQVQGYGDGALHHFFYTGVTHQRCLVRWTWMQLMDEDEDHNPHAKKDSQKCWQSSLAQEQVINAKEKGRKQVKHQ
ncbi:hypothetical protein M404DRAFT_26749 [Pisolithus tinctorius Marx 270]|uniref:Retrotransposon gag domain-containing protein n=1 Tax=Pisolithus tinctorius Marx 270 TaxID=870435 RepID=A0A0C3J3Y9_PISTI|nr:hypothetical protein M404DRAFT_26749 [Pisolithus tinctorius Marx 270]